MHSKPGCMKSTTSKAWVPGAGGREQGPGRAKIAVLPPEDLVAKRRTKATASPQLSTRQKGRRRQQIFHRSPRRSYIHTYYNAHIPQLTSIAPKKCGAASLPAANSEVSLCASDAMLSLVLRLSVAPSVSSSSPPSPSPSSPLPVCTLWLAEAGCLPADPSPSCAPSGGPLLLRVFLPPRPPARRGGSPPCSLS